MKYITCSGKIILSIKTCFQPGKPFGHWFLNHSYLYNLLVKSSHSYMLIHNRKYIFNKSCDNRINCFKMKCLLVLSLLTKLQKLIDKVSFSSFMSRINPFRSLHNPLFKCLNCFETHLRLFLRQYLSTINN